MKECVQEQVELAKHLPARDERGRLLPGHTANPKGRPKHSQDAYNKKTLKALSKFWGDTVKQQQMIKDAWEKDPVRTLGLLLGARSKEIAITGNTNSSIVINLLGAAPQPGLEPLEKEITSPEDT